MIVLQYYADVRLLLLTARPELETNRRLEAAARDLKVDPLVADACRITTVAGSQLSLLYGHADLLDPAPNAVIARVGNWRPDSVLAALEVAVARAVATPNPPSAIRVGRDHWRTIEVLTAAGLPVPTTVTGADPEQLAESASSEIGFPVVVKQRRSRMGVGVIRCSGRDQLEAVLDSLWRTGDEVVVQRFEGSGAGTLRLLVVGGEVVAAARLEPPEDDWRSNAARGGTVVRHRPSDVESELATSAANAIGLGVCGVDLLHGDQVVVCEVNPTPGFLHLEAATGVDAAAAMVRHAIACATIG